MKRKRNSAMKKTSPDMVLHRTYRGTKQASVSSATQGLAYKLRTLSVPIVDIRNDNVLLSLGLEDQGHGVWRFNANLKPKRYHRPIRLKESKEEAPPIVKVSEKPLVRSVVRDHKVLTGNRLSGNSVAASEGRKTTRKSAEKVEPIVIDLSSDEENVNVYEPNTRVKDRKTKLNSLSSDKSKKDNPSVKDKNVGIRAESKVELSPMPKTRNTRNQLLKDSPKENPLNLKGKKLPQTLPTTRRNKDTALPLGVNGVKKTSLPSVKEKVDENSNTSKGKKYGLKRVASPDGGNRTGRKGESISLSSEKAKLGRVRSLLNKKSELSKKAPNLLPFKSNSLKFGEAVAISKKASLGKTKRTSGSRKNAENDRDYKVSPSKTANCKKPPTLKVTRKHQNISQIHWCEICGAELDSLDNKLEHEFRHREPRQLLVLLRRCLLNDTTIKLPIYVSSEDLAAIPDPPEDTSSPINSDDETHPRFPVEEVLNHDEENAYESYSSSDDEFEMVGNSAPLGEGGTQEPPPNLSGARKVVLVDAATSPFTTPERGTPVRSPRSVGSKDRSKRKSQVKMRLWDGPPITRSGRVVKITEKTKECLEISCVRALFSQKTDGGSGPSSPQTEADGVDVNSLQATECSDATSFLTAEGSDDSNLVSTENCDGNDQMTSEGDDIVEDAHEGMANVDAEKQNSPLAENADDVDIKGDKESGIVDTAVDDTLLQDQFDDVVLRLEEETDMDGSVSVDTGTKEVKGSLEKIEAESMEKTIEVGHVENGKEDDSMGKEDISVIELDSEPEMNQNVIDDEESSEVSEKPVANADWLEDSIVSDSNDMIDGREVSDSAQRGKLSGPDNMETPLEKDPEPEKTEVGLMENEKEGYSMPTKILDVDGEKEVDQMGKEDVAGNELDSDSDMNQNLVNDVESSGTSEKPTTTFDGVEEFVASDGNDVIEERGVSESAPEGKLSDPEGRLSDPEGRLSDPEGRLSDPEGRLSDPEGRLSDPEGRLSDPEGRLSDQEGRLSDPEGRLSDPEGELTDPEDLKAFPKKDSTDLLTEDKISPGQMLEDTIDKNSKEDMLVDEGNDALVGGTVAETVEMQEPENEFNSSANDTDVSKYNDHNDEGLEDISDDEWTDISDKEMEQSPQFGGNLGDVEMDEGPSSAVDTVEGAMDLEETEKDACLPDPMCTGEVTGESMEEEMKDLESAEDAMMSENMMDAMVGVLSSKDDMGIVEPTAEVDMTESGEEREAGCTAEVVSVIQDKDSVDFRDEVQAGGLDRVEGGSDALVTLDLPREEQIVNTISENVSEPKCQGDKKVQNDSTLAVVIDEVPGDSKLSVNGIELVAVVGRGQGDDDIIPCGERVEVAETTNTVFFGSNKGDKGGTLKGYGVSVKKEICAAKRNKDAGK